MNEVQFKAQYITNFLSSYMAGRYDDDCLNSHHGKPYNHQPIESAKFLADKAWEQLEHHTKELQTVPDNLFEFTPKDYV
jgi:hypothetical protein